MWYWNLVLYIHISCLSGAGPDFPFEGRSGEQKHEYFQRFIAKKQALSPEAFSIPCCIGSTLAQFRTLLQTSSTINNYGAKTWFRDAAIGCGSGGALRNTPMTSLPVVPSSPTFQKLCGIKKLENQGDCCTKSKLFRRY